VAADDIIQPPSNMTVDHEHRAVLYLPDGRALVRQAGFRAEGHDALSRLSEARREVSSAWRAGEKR
jgi:hypothetical protein